MTPVRVYGGGLSCAGSGVVDSACRGGPFMTPVRVYGGGLSGMRFGGVDSACRGGAISDAPKFFAVGWGAVVSLLRCVGRLVKFRVP